MPPAPLPFDPDYSPRKLRGAPLLPPPYVREDGLRLKAQAPEAYTERANPGRLPRTVEGLRNLVIFHLTDGDLLGDDPGTTRRIIQVDADADLDDAAFRALSRRWPRLGIFPTLAARDAWLGELDAMLRTASLID